MKLLLIAALLLAADVFAQAKKPWEWTDEERIAVRSDPVKARERIAALRERALSMGTDVGKMQQDGDFIDATTQPELLFPHELFHDLIESTLNSMGGRESIDVRYGKVLRELDLPDDLWLRLEQIVAPYRSVVLQNRELAHRIAKLSPAEQEKTYGDQMTAARAQCRALHAALHEAEAEFGKERFLRFLYSEPVTEGYGITVFGVERPEVLRYRGRGCP